VRFVVSMWSKTEWGSQGRTDDQLRDIFVLDLHAPKDAVTPLLRSNCLQRFLPDSFSVAGSHVGTGD